MRNLEIGMHNAISRLRGTYTYKKGTEVQISRLIVTKVQMGPSYHGGLEQSYKKAIRIIKVSYKTKGSNKAKQ